MGGTILVICILLLIVVGAVISSAKHFKGEGGCCGGGGFVKIKGDKIKKVVAVKTIYIEGMHCCNCSARVQKAVVKLGREATDDELIRCVEKAGYTVKNIA